MSIHASRPLPPDKSSHPAIVDPPRPPAPASTPAPAASAAMPAPAAVAVPAEASAAEPRPAVTARRAADAPEPAGGPWYRREAWLAAAGLALLFVTTAIWAPQATKIPLLGAGAVCMFVGLALLARRGVPPRGSL